MNTNFMYKVVEARLISDCVPPLLRTSSYYSLKLSYVIRDKPPSTYTSLKDQLHYLVSVDGSTAEYRRDRKIIFSYLDTSIEEFRGSLSSQLII